MQLTQGSIFIDKKKITVYYCIIVFQLNPVKLE